MQSIETTRKRTKGALPYQWSFGTAGIRAKMGRGAGELNSASIRRISQGFADYINEKGKELGIVKPTVVIAYDTRRNSKRFAKEAACVLAGNNITVQLFPRHAPTPLLSFAITQLAALAGIVITASHNPPEYNGYKVYWSDGSQVVSPHEEAIIKKINVVTGPSIAREQFEPACARGDIVFVAPFIKDQYIEKITSLSLDQHSSKHSLGVVYTPVHGTGHGYVQRVLKQRRFTNLKVVKQETIPIYRLANNRRTLNPEEVDCFSAAFAIAQETDKIIIATDPDADRLGIFINNRGKWHKLSGNEVGILLLDHHLTILKRSGKWPENGKVVTTIVSSLLANKIAESRGLQVIETMIGFRYIASKINELADKKNGTFVFAMEESGGYLLGDAVRDKDAISAALNFAELSADLDANQKTPLDRLAELYEQYGHYDDITFSFVYTPEEERKYISIIEKLGNFEISTIGRFPVASTISYKLGKIYDHKNKLLKDACDVVRTNTVAYRLQNGCRVTIRMSGTEPKVKCYFNIVGGNKEALRTMGDELTAWCKRLFC